MYWIYCSGDAIPWTSAEAVCVLEEAHVASIADPVESDFIWQRAVLSESGSLWIGLNTIASQNVYVWSDSKPVRWLTPLCVYMITCNSIPMDFVGILSVSLCWTFIYSFGQRLSTEFSIVMLKGYTKILRFYEILAPILLFDLLSR